MGNQVAYLCLSISNGRGMCVVGMQGMGMPGDFAKVKKVTTIGVNRGEKHEVEQLVSVPKHSTCISGSFGTGSYSCKCQAPFVEDLRVEQPNCLIRVGSCDSKLCLHGTCVTTANQKVGAACLCYRGYDGPRCQHHVCLSKNQLISIKNHQACRTSFQQ